MAKTRLLQAACTAALLAAVPALAQTNTPNSAAQPAPAQPAPTDNSNMAPAHPSHSASGEGHMTHRSAMSHSGGMMHGRSDTSQNAAVDRLNEQSFQAAQQGQTFGGVGGSDSGTMTTPSGASSPGSMPNGSATPPSAMPPSSMPGNAPAGSTKQP